MPRTFIIPVDEIKSHILELRGHRVLLDMHLATFYEIPTYRFNEAVSRNLERFPSDFRFQLTNEEFASLKSQIAMSNQGRGGRRTLPWAFTEHGALMAANILHSSRAVQMSLYVIRAFIALRKLALEPDQNAFAAKLAELDVRVGQHDEEIAQIMTALRQLLAPSGPEHDRKIGYHSGNR